MHSEQETSEFLQKCMKSEQSFFQINRELILLLKSPEKAPTLKDLKSIIIEPSFNGLAIRSLAEWP